MPPFLKETGGTTFVNLAPHPPMKVWKSYPWGKHNNWVEVYVPFRGGQRVRGSLFSLFACMW